MCFPRYMNEKISLRPECKTGVPRLVGSTAQLGRECCGQSGEQKWRMPNLKTKDLGGTEREADVVVLKNGELLSMVRWPGSKRESGRTGQESNLNALLLFSSCRGRKFKSPKRVLYT